MKQLYCLTSGSTYNDILVFYRIWNIVDSMDKLSKVLHFLIAETPNISIESIRFQVGYSNNQSGVDVDDGNNGGSWCL